MDNDKSAFLEKYKDCAEEAALKKIWTAKLINATGLNISWTQVSDLSPLKDLTNLQVLDVSSTQVSDLSPLKGLVNLQVLDIYNRQVRDITPLKDLLNLVRLDISSTEVSDLSPLKGLLNLENLNISLTQVTDLTPLIELNNLQRIDISKTQINDLRPFSNLISKGINIMFYKTEKLDFNSFDNNNETQLEAVEIQLSDLEYNMSELGAISKELDFSININECPLLNPPIEIAKQGNAAILRYWAEQQRTGLKQLNEARLLIVGQGGAGKTTLKEKLKNPHAAMPEPDMTTRGIVIEPLVFKNTEGVDFTLQIWDFGGQNIQHYAHQFFMSDSAVYALLSNEREQNSNFQYWLNIIEMLGKESPVVIVRNEIGGHCEPLKNAAQIQERFPNIRSIESVNLQIAATDPRFKTLEQMLKSAAQLLPHVKKEYPTSFSNVRDKLQQLSENQQVITFVEFKNLCKAEGIEDVELMNDYRAFL